MAVALHTDAPSAQTGRVNRAYLIVTCIALAGCSDDAPREEVRHPLCDRVDGLCTPPGEGRVGEPTVLAPSSALPAEFVSQAAHNNLDVVWHADRLYLAIRTAPNHFAGAETVMYVVSSSDLSTWRHEGEVSIGTDVREPQLVTLGGRLWLYYAVLGDNPLAFEPQGTEIVEYRGPGDWSEARPAFEPGLIPWRIKSYPERLELIGYIGGESIYASDSDEQALHTLWLESTDGEEWTPVAEEAVVRSGGGSETDLVIRDDGSLVAVARNEAGDETGFGSHVCTAPADALGDWTCDSDPRKYDSPLMLIHDDQPWLIGRRNLTETGHYDLGLPEDVSLGRSLQYQADYWLHPKRCSLWRVDGETRAVAFEADLPSRGDTCFPEAVALGDGLYLVFNYTSPLDGEDVGWRTGQLGETWVYWTVVDLADR